jgi:putative ABC transport system permease protein
VSAAVLLIAYVNCAGLLFLRVLARQPELAVRLALGASRGNLAMMLLVENAILGAGAALIACVTAAAMGRLLERVLLVGDFGAHLVSLPTIWTFAWLVSEGCMLLMTLPMLTRTTVGNLAAALCGGDRVRGASDARGRMLLIVVQVSLVSVLLIVAGLFAESFGRAKGADLGFDQDEAYIVAVDFAGMLGRKSTGLPPQQLSRRLIAAVRAVAGVSAAGSASSAPFGFTAGTKITIPGRDTASLPKTAGWFTIVDDGYAASLGLRLKGGRWLWPSDVDSVARVAVFNETMARWYWPGEPALGKCFSDGGPRCLTVVGIVADTRRANIREDPRAQVYEPEKTGGTTPDNLPRSVVFRTGGGQPVINAVRAAIASAAPGLPFVSMLPIVDVAAEKRQAWTLGASMLSLFAWLGLCPRTKGHETTLGNLLASDRRSRSCGGAVVRRFSPGGANSFRTWCHGASGPAVRDSGLRGG